MDGFDVNLLKLPETAIGQQADIGLQALTIQWHWWSIFV